MQQSVGFLLASLRLGDIRDVVRAFFAPTLRTAGEQVNHEYAPSYGNPALRHAPVGMYAEPPDARSDRSR